MRPHLPEDELHAYLDGELSVNQRAEIAGHLLKCAACRDQMAEAAELKNHVTGILALASPYSIHRRGERPQTPIRATPGRWLRRQLPLMVAGIGTVLVAGSFLRRPATAPFGIAELREAFVSPFRKGGGNAPSTSDSTSGFSLSEWGVAIAATVQTAPTVSSIPGEAPEVHPMATYIPDPIEQQLAERWRSVPVNVAMAETQGVLPRLEGLIVSEIRVLQSPLGARPTILSRYLLPDGRSVWLAEGAEEELASVQTMLQQNGLSISQAKRTRPDYVATEDGTRRTNRMLIVAATLSSDSLNAIAARVK